MVVAKALAELMILGRQRRLTESVSDVAGE